MSTKEAYQEKIEAEAELALAKLAELKAQARTSAAGEDSWEQLKYDVEHGWNALNSTIQDAVAKFKR